MSNNPPAPPAIVAAYHIAEGVIRYFMLDNVDQFAEAEARLLANGYRRGSVRLIDIYDSVPPRPAMKVREVIAALQQCDPDLPVVMEDGNEWFVHASRVELPDPGTGYVLPTLIIGDQFNCRAW